MARRHAPLSAIAFLLALAVSGCGTPTAESSATSASPATPRPSATTPAPGASDSPGPASPTDEATGEAPTPFPGSVQPSEQAASADAFGTITGVRTGSHEGFDRVVLTFEGPGTPGWFAHYTDAPVHDGSGTPIDIAGTAFLDLYVRGTGYPMDTGIAEYSGPNPLVPDTAAGGAKQVRGVAYGGVFEGDTQVIIGLAGDAQPFRIFTLTNPTRVVVDIRTAS
jgi:hypothetical protein